MTSTASARSTDRFAHEAAIYRGLEGIVDVVLPFLQEGLEQDEPMLVSVLPDRIEALTNALGADAGRISFVDMSEVGHNPACIIPVWRQFVESHTSSTTVRGVGEPVWAGRRAVEIEECRLHESLLNLAFDDGPAWRLMCPYDAAALPADVIRDARRTHPVVGPATRRHTRDYEGHAHAFAEFTTPLPVPAVSVAEIRFGPEDLSELRSVVRRLCLVERLSADATADLVLAAHELATNSIRHGGGAGTLRAWSDRDALILEISDTGLITDPMVGRALDADLTESGRGVWMANQLCDLVQVRSSAHSGTAIRLHAWL
jgi:anti-sigma regulatory factor (Ser/Thr protein kinase)